MADSVDAFLTEQPPASPIDATSPQHNRDALPLGLTFSFPVEQTALDGRGGWHLDRGRVDLGRDRRDDVLCVLSTRAQGPTSPAISQGEAPRHHLRW